MPYVICPDCATTAYTAARFTTIDDCPLCGTPLRRSDPQLRRGTGAQWTVTASVAVGGAVGGADRAFSGLPFQSLNVPR